MRVRFFVVGAVETNIDDDDIISGPSFTVRKMC